MKVSIKPITIKEALDKGIYEVVTFSGVGQHNKRTHLTLARSASFLSDKSGEIICMIQEEYDISGKDAKKSRDSVGEIIHIPVTELVFPFHNEFTDYKKTVIVVEKNEFLVHIDYTQSNPFRFEEIIIDSKRISRIDPDFRCLVNELPRILLIGSEEENAKTLGAISQDGKRHFVDRNHPLLVFE